MFSVEVQGNGSISLKEYGEADTSMFTYEQVVKKEDEFDFTDKNKEEIAEMILDRICLENEVIICKKSSIEIKNRIKSLIGYIKKNREECDLPQINSPRPVYFYRHTRNGSSIIEITLVLQF